MMAGQLHHMIDGIASAAPLAQSGKLKPLAVLSEKRHPLLPQVPTIAEAAFPGSEASSWFGNAGPKGLAPAAVERLSREVSAILQARDAQKAVRDIYMIPTYMPAEAFSDLIRREITYWTKASRAVGVRPE